MDQEPTDPGPQIAVEDIRWTHSLAPLKVGEGATTPLVPLLAASLGASDLTIGAMETVFSVLMMLGAFLWGRASDAVQRRKAFIVLGFAGVSLTLAAIALTDSVLAIVVLRGLQGFSIAAYVTVGGALIADWADPDQVGRHMGYMHLVGGVGYTIGLLGGAAVLLWLQPQHVFGMAASLTAVSVFLGVAWIMEPDWHLRREQVHRIFRRVLWPFTPSPEHEGITTDPAIHQPELRDPSIHRRAWAYLGATLLAFLATSAAFSLLPLYLSRLGLSDTVVLLLFVTFSATTTVVFQPAGVLAERWGYRRVQVGSLVLRAAAFAALVVPLADQLWWLVGFFLLSASTWAAMTTTGLAAMYRGMQIRRRGELAGIYTVASGIGLSLGSLLAGVVVSWAGFDELFLLAAGLSLVAAVVIHVMVHPRPPVDTGRGAASEG